MGWKLRKDKLREGTSEATETPADTAPAAIEPTDEMVAPAAVSAFMPAGEDAHDTAATILPVLDKPDAFDAPAAVDTDDDPLPAFAPIVFDHSPATEDAPTFSDTEVAPAFTDFADREVAPVFAPLSESDAPAYALPPGEVAETDTPDFAALPVLETPEADAPEPLSAFAPYEPEPFTPTPEAVNLTPTPEPDAIDFAPTPEPDAINFAPVSDTETFDPEPEVGAMAFDPQSPAVTPLHDEAEDTSEAVFDPSFGMTGTDLDDVRVPLADPEHFMNRDALAAGLVSTDPGAELPRVSPFVIPSGEATDFSDIPAGPHTLVVRLGSLSATYPLVKPITTIGRPDTDAQIYPDVEVELDDSVSRRHAEVHIDGDEILLVDMGSTNGTFLNGEELSPNQAVPLLHGDHIRIGERTEIVFE